MSSPVESFLDSLKPTLTLVDEILDSWGTSNVEGCYQFPALMAAVAVKLNWSETDLRTYDPIVRAYVRSHPTWYVTRGAHGGIMRRSEHNKKEAAKQAKEQAKAEIKAALEAKAQQAASQVAPSTAQNGPDNTNTVSQ